MKNEIYGGSWPSLDSKIVAAANLPNQDYKIQICFKHNAYDNITPENAIIYASTNEVSGWTSVNLIYDPEESRWYTGSGVKISDFSWPDVKSQMIKNNWKPVEYSE